MSAQAHNIHLVGAASSGARHGHPIFKALVELATVVTREQLARLFEEADDVIFEMAEHAKDPDERRVLMDTMLVLRRQQQAIIQSFVATLADTLDDPLANQSKGLSQADPESWTLQATDDLDESIVATSMEQRAVSRFSNELFEIERRLSTLSRNSAEGISTKALDPARIVGAFRKAVKNLDLDFRNKIVIYKLFDRYVMQNVGSLYKGAADILVQNGVEASHHIVGSKASGHNVPSDPTNASSQVPSNSFTRAAQSLAGQFGSTVQPPGGLNSGQPQPEGFAGAAPSAPVMQLVAEFARCVPAATTTNATLATDFLTGLQSLSNGQQGPGWIPLSNLGAAASWFDALAGKLENTPGAQDLFARLQMPILKRAVADPNFLANPSHPMRRAMYDLADILGSSAANGGPLTGEVERLVDEICRSYDLDPEKVKDAASEDASRETLDSLLDEDKRRSDEHAKAATARIRHLVVHHIKRAIGGKIYPQDVMRFFLSGIGAMFTALYLTKGRNSPRWVAADRFLARVISSLSGEGDVATRSALFGEAQGRLQRLGMNDERAMDVLSGLKREYAALDARLPESPELEERDQSESISVAPPASHSVVQDPTDPLAVLAVDLDRTQTGIESPKPATTHASSDVAQFRNLASENQSSLMLLLGTIAHTGHVFRVFDSDANQTHFMRVLTFHPRMDRIAFEDFMGSRVLHLSAMQFASDVVSHRSEPAVTDESITDALALLAEYDYVGIKPSRATWASK